MQFLQDSLLNLDNSKLSLAYKLKKQVDECIDELDGFLDVLKENWEENYWIWDGFRIN